MQEKETSLGSLISLIDSACTLKDDFATSPTHRQYHDLTTLRLSRRCLWDNKKTSILEQEPFTDGSDLSIGWQHVPCDILHLILTYLDHKDIPNARLVCREWKSSISSSLFHLRPRRFIAIQLKHSFPMVQTLDLKALTSALRDEDLFGLHALSPSLSTLVLDGCDDVTDAIAYHILALSNLTKLSLRQCIKLSDAFFWILSCNRNKLQRQSPTSPMISPRSNNSSNSTDNHVYIIQQQDPLFLSTVSHPPPLTFLDLTGCVMLTEQAYSCLPLGFPGLTELRIGGCGSHSNINDLCLSHVGHCKNLQVLDMSGCCTITALNSLESLSRGLKSLNLWNCLRLTPASLTALSSCTALTELSLRGCQWMDDSCIEHLVPLSGLCKLDLRACEQFSGEQLSRLSKLQCLSEINLKGCYAMSDQGMASLGTLHMLRVLAMPECWQVTAAGLQHLQHLQYLRDINVAGCRSISNQLHHPLPGLSSLLSLTSLILKGCDRLNIGALQNLGSLASLDLSGCREISSGVLLPLKAASSTLSALRLNHCMGLKGSNALVGIEMLPCLTSLHLGGCTNLVGTALSSLRGLSSLKFLSLEGCSNVPLLDRGLAVFESSCPDLSTICLQRCNTLTDEGLMHLGSLKKLRCVNLSDCNSITGVGFLSWMDMNDLHSLYLSGCINVHDKGVHALTLGLTSLRELNLKHCKAITDAGVGYIADALHRLTSLSFQGMISLTDIGVKELWKLKLLQSLELQFCWQFGDKGIVALAKELKNLKSLCLMYSWKVTDESMFALAEHCTSLIELNILGLHRLSIQGRNSVNEKLLKNGLE